MNPDFTLIWPLSCLKDGDHLSPPLTTSPLSHNPGLAILLLRANSSLLGSR